MPSRSDDAARSESIYLTIVGHSRAEQKLSVISKIDRSRRIAIHFEE